MNQKRILKWSSVLVALTLCLQLFAGFGPLRATAAEPAALQTYFIAPVSGDGVHLQYNAEDIRVKGTLSNGKFTFGEAAAVTMTATFDEGWTYNRDFSYFFGTDSKGVTVTENADGSVRFQYRAAAAKTIDFADLENVWIHATADKLPTLKITTDVPIWSINKDTWVAANFDLTLGSKKFTSGDYQGAGEIKGRGNTSWQDPKKPYSLKLGKKKSLLDIPETKKYAIVPSYGDASMLRNYITYKSGLKLDGIEYTPKTEFVDVYLNGQYNGVYILVERIDIEKTKVNIKEADENNITGGYIIEKDAGDKVSKPKDPWFNAPFQANPSEDLFTLKAPDPDDKALLTDMLSYLEGYMQRVHDAIMDPSADAYKQYVDTDTWVDFLIMQELSKNVDGNLKTSCYFYKEADNDTLYMTALWDFDNAYGNANWDNKSPNNDQWDCPNGLGSSDFMVINSSCPWFKTLYSKPEFQQKVHETYTKYRYTLIEDMQQMIGEQGAYLAKAIKSDPYTYESKYTNGVRSLSNWLKSRVQWLDGKWLQDTPQTHTVTVSVQGNGTADQETLLVEDKNTAAITIRPEQYWEIDTVTCNGLPATDLVAGNVFTTPILTADAQIVVTLKDNTPPEPSGFDMTGLPESDYTRRGVALRTAELAVYTINGVTTPRYVSGVTLDLDGTYTVSAKNRAGEVTPTYTFTIDKTKPVLTSNVPDSRKLNGPARFEADEDVLFTLDDVEAAAYARELVVEQPGTHVVKAYDRAGNYGGAYRFTITEERGLVLSGAPEQPTRGSVVITANVPVQYTLNGETLGTGYVYRCAVTESGTYTLEAVDASGNKQSVRFVIDKVKPVIAGDAPSGTKSNKPVTITADETVNFIVNGETVSTGTEYTVTAQGRTIVRVYDLAGNYGGVYDVRIDSQPPVLTAVQEGTNVRVANGATVSFNVTITSSEKAKFIVNGVEAENYANFVKLRENDTFTVQAVDMDGNRSETFTITIDK